MSEESSQKFAAESQGPRSVKTRSDAPSSPPEPPTASRRGGKGGIGISILRSNIHNNPPGESTQNSPSASTMGSFPPPLDSSSFVRSNSRMSFFRNLIGQRNDDYRSDAPQQYLDQRSQRRPAGVTDTSRHRSNRSTNRNNTRTTNASRWSFRPSSAEMQPEEEEQSGSILQRCCRSFFKPSPTAMSRMKCIINSRIWHVWLLFFTLVLLFGSQIQELWIPKGGDTAFDVLFTVDFVFLFLDVCLRCFVEPSYFYFPIFKKVDGSSSYWGNIRLGSFMFWCDLVSTCLLLWDISYINRRLFDASTIDLQLDNFGRPNSGISQINTALPIRWQPTLIITILRTTRVARFIRASTVVKTSSKVNWYWILQRFNPLWYIEYARARHLRKIRQATTDSVLDEDDGGSSDTKSKDLIRRSFSWGNVASLAISEVQAREQKKEKKGLKRFYSSSLIFFGIRKDKDEELKRRIVAATKIQRAWRSFSLANESTHFDEAADDAWADQRENSTQSGQSPSKKTSPKKSLIGKSLRRSFESRSPDKNRQESQVGSAMRELTGQRVAVGVIVAMILTVLFTYSENDATRPSTMVVLHSQTSNDAFANQSLNAARASSVPDLYEYEAANGTIYTYELEDENVEDLREREILRITITGQNETVLNGTTLGYFSNRELVRDQALVELLTTIFILLIWFFGVTAFAGPVMTLVVTPIERMVRLLGMLMVDPLGYQSSSRYKNFVNEEDQLTKNSRWTKEVLKGMETSFLMSTITRIGSLMKVGFGSAGVEIIRNNLEKGQKKDTLFLNSQGSTVACIFLFCDIRQFTDATESLQEEVFLFTNKIAAVVHSICHSYGGAANKNVGDAFLLSWLLEDESPKTQSRTFSEGIVSPKEDSFTAKNNQADKALLSVVKICIALQHDKYYIESMTETARDALLTKLSTRKGPVVQMGFGLHAGKAIQGALGSQRKIDATYVSEAVEFSEFLESSTKKYGVKVLMSDNFHRLLQTGNMRRCRKVDQILINNEDDDEESLYDRDVMELFTFDMDIDALWRKDDDDKISDVDSINNESVVSGRGSKKDGRPMLKTRRRSLKGLNLKGFNANSSSGLDISEELSPVGTDGTDGGPSSARGASGEGGDDTVRGHSPPELVLPTGPALYNSNVWQSEEMRKIRQRYSDGLFFQKFNSGLQSFYAKDWDYAKQCFETILERSEDGPSSYFLKQIEKHNGVPPRHFTGYGTT